MPKKYCWLDNQRLFYKEEEYHGRYNSKKSSSIMGGAQICNSITDIFNEGAKYLNSGPIVSIITKQMGPAAHFAYGV